MPDLHIGQSGADVISFMTAHFTFVFDAINSILMQLLRWSYLLFSSLDAVVMVVIFSLLALASTRKIVLSLVLALGLLVIVSMGLWQETMESLAAVIVASAIALAVGIPIGIWTAFNSVVRAMMQPVLDFMQALPVFVYLLPTILFFGIGVVPGVVATTVFSIPPAVRLTQLGIRQVDAETVEAARAFGASRFDVLREVQFPLARPSIMAGVNQVIMLAVSMVVIAGLVGGGGLGNVVVTAVQTLDVSKSVEGGLAVVILAIYLDRVTAALGSQEQKRPAWWPRRRVTVHPTREVPGPPEVEEDTVSAVEFKEPHGATRGRP